MEMENEALTDSRICNRGDNIKWIYFLRQAFVTSGCCCIYLCIGIVFGAPTVFIPQLRQANITVTENMASWLSSAVNYTAIPWIIINITIANIFGRKKIAIFICFATIFSFIIFYFSKTTTYLIISEVAFGPTLATGFVINVIIISEYTSPKYRGMFLCVKSASVLWGMWISNAIGTFAFWGYIPIIGFVLALCNLTICFWPESPQWLASKNRFAECRRAHRWLKGQSEAAEIELQNIIQSQTEHNAALHPLKNLKFITHREFCLPLLISMLPVFLYELSGKYVTAIYAIDILKKFIKNYSSAYTGMLILDGITVIGAYIGSFVAKFLKRRTLLLSASVTAIVFLLLLSLYLYLLQLSICTENAYVSITLLSGFSIAISSGPIVMATALYGELIPYRYKSVATAIVGILFLFIHGTFLKLGPMIFKAFGTPGTFLFYALSSGFCTLLIYLYLPETKDKTLLEIEEYFKERTIIVTESRKLVV